MEIFFPFRVKFGHETVGHLDASLDKIARGAKVLQVRLTGGAMRFAARASNGGNHQVSRLEPFHFVSNLGDHSKRFMAKDEII